MTKIAVSREHYEQIVGAPLVLRVLAERHGSTVLEDVVLHTAKVLAGEVSEPPAIDLPVS